MSAGDTESPSSKVQRRAASEGSANGKTPRDAATTHASITELELLFAQSPESSAYVDLCEAYLDQGRFMEAMVVCKKGIKAQPDAVEGRVLLARVYAVQKKYKRALTELDALVDKHPDNGAVLLARGRVRLDSGSEDDGIADLKRALDLDPTLADASALLAERDIVYPEPVAEPEPAPEQGRAMPPPAPPATVDLSADLPRGDGGTGDLPPARAGSFAASAADLEVPATADLPPFRSAPPRAASQFGMGAVPGRAHSVLPQVLEGEDELERIAQKVAAEKPDRGRPKTTAILVVALTVVGLGLVTQRLLSKRRVEAIDRLTTLAVPAFNRDTYGSYKQAAAYLEEIVEDYDEGHALTLGRLAHTYAILWGEHGESDMKPKLDAILARAQAKAPKVSHTVAAQTLAALYGGTDRHAAAERARAVAEPFVRDNQGQGAAPTHADLALAIAQLDLGEYEDARKTLGVTKQALPGSVRAKVWHARASYRARRIQTAGAGFAAALRAEPNHPGALTGLALAKLERGSLEAAAEDLLRFDKLAREQPKNISPRDQALAEYARSVILRSAGEDAKATGAYEQAVRLDPKNADFPFGLGRWLVEADRAKDAITPLKKAVAMEPNRWAFLVELAEAEMRNGQYDDAKQHIDEALAKAPNDTEALIAKARWLRRMKQPNTEEYLQGLLEKHPSMRADVQLELGRHYRRLNRLEDAKKALETAIENMSSQPLASQADILLSYGRLMDDRGEEVTAANSYEKAAQLGSLEGWYRLAIVLAKQGRSEHEKALKACDSYLAAGSSLRYSKSAQVLCDSLR